VDGESVALCLFAAAPVVAGLAARAYIRRVRRTAKGAPPRRAQLVTGNVLVFLFLASFAALAGECWLRFVHDSTDSYGLLRTTDRWMARHYKLNNQGVRDDVDYDLGLVPAGKRRVTFVGDSFTAGHGVPNVQDRFANRVRAARAGWELNGLDTGRELGIVEDELPKDTYGRYRYDVVVLVYCLNDVADAMPEYDALRQRLAPRLERGVLARTSCLFDLCRAAWIVSSEPELQAYYPSVAAAYEGPVWDFQRERLRRIHAAVASRGGRLAVVTFPFLADLGPGYRFGAAHEKLAAFWRETGVPALDLRATFDGRAPADLVVGRWDAHPNEAAHAMAASAILPFLDGVMGEK
jgi:hypothetical protein